MSVKAAQRVKEIVDELSEIRLADLGNKGKAESSLRELDSALTEVRNFAEAIQGVFGQFPATVIRGRVGRPPKAFGRKAVGRPRATARPMAAAWPMAAARPMAPRPSPLLGRRGRRGPGEFNATPFILTCVQDAGSSGIRPKEIVTKVQAAAPGHHVRPSALVSTILTRLKKRGAIRRRTGKWYPA